MTHRCRTAEARPRAVPRARGVRQARQRPRQEHAAQLTRGEKITEVLKQPQFHPQPVEEQVAVIFAATSGYLDEVPTNKIAEWETRSSNFLRQKHPEITQQIRSRHRSSATTTRRASRRPDRGVQQEALMPSVRDLRDRIRSMKNTQQITKAMKQVAAAKIRRADCAAQAVAPVRGRARADAAGSAGRGRPRRSSVHEAGYRRRAGRHHPDDRRQGARRRVQRQPDPCRRS